LLRAAGYVIRNAEGEPVRMIGTAIDITQFTQADEG
jgi:PAS domain-containing protein